ncbi:MAG TPA: FlgD immunoglobulin-like domain containing protein [Candidatus Kapabacteria bacterium]|nr:FlgD immunoglobulin-like domain containing protein [Candidatus Kapabacteria bacterium]
MYRHNGMQLLFSLALMVTACCIGPHVMSAQDEGITWSVIGSGGIIGATDGAYRQSATIGQGIIGISADGTTTAFEGFWLPITLPSSVDNEAGPLGSFRLRNFPNPFSTTTTIAYQLDEPGRITIAITDLMGNPIATVADRTEAAGEHAAEWDGLTSGGERASGGAYVCTLTVQSSGSKAGNTRTERRRLMLIR